MVHIKLKDQEKKEDMKTTNSKVEEVDSVDESPGEDKAEAKADKDIPLEDMKKAELIEKLRETQKTADKNYDLYIRSLAEIENLKKRFQKDKNDLAKYANESLIRQLLTVLDNMEKAISSSTDGNSVDAVREGVELTLKGLLDIMEKAGVKQVEAMGRPFDPNFHEALMEREAKDTESGTIIQELQKGYLLNDRLIRPSMVVVSKNNS
ncbi:Protein GrpE [uncultured Desulfobacterium sp.]|uniref:Protein GrpE n=1 Tax=uncultured Desulfobacterium sp. TaxID=201089 RepID=A0A445MRB3_9BACT|nr:Protein GrpE [uncultured Desulfobacterium sp.]